MLSPGAPKGSCCRFAGQLLTLNSHWRLSGGTGAVLCVRRPGPQAPPCPALSFTHTSRPSFCYGRGFTLALPKRSQHATLPDSASLPPQETDTRAGLSRGGADCRGPSDTHHQQKAAEHMSQGKPLSLYLSDGGMFGWVVQAEVLDIDLESLKIQDKQIYIQGREKDKVI